MKFAVLACLACLVVTGCSESYPCDDSSCLTAQGDERYLRLNDGFNSEAECPTDGLPNCHAQLDLCANGGFIMVLEDIVEEGLYTRDGDRVSATLYLPSGTQAFSATVKADGTLESTDIGGSHPWQRAVLDAVEMDRLASSCAAIEGRPWFN